MYLIQKTIMSSCYTVDITKNIDNTENFLSRLNRTHFRIEQGVASKEERDWFKTMQGYISDNEESENPLSWTAPKKAD